MEPILGLYLTKAQLARQFAVSLRTIDRWCAEVDGLPHAQLGRRKLFDPNRCRQWIDKRMHQPNPRRAA